MENLTEFEYPESIISKKILENPQSIIYYGAVNNPQQLLFCELEAKASQLAKILTHRYGIKQNSVVTVLLPRNADFVVALYAIWKAGMVFMPLSYDWDYEFIKNRILLSNAAIVITHSSTRAKIGDLTPNQQAMIIDQEDFSQLQPNLASIQKTSENDAYIYCSSGTTSKPKMIYLPYSGILDRISGINQIMDIDTKDDVIMSFCDFGFDASLCEILMSLFSGCSLVLAPEYVRANPLVMLPQYLQTFQGKKPTTTILIPSILKFITDISLYPGLRKILTTGEKCQLSWLKPLIQNGWQIWNGYGPTETCFGATTTPICDSDSIISLHQESMGVSLVLEERPEFSQLYKEPQFEVFIRGKGIGRYHKSNEDKQINFSHIEQGVQQFRTGDLVRKLDSGTIEFTRRIDDMRKIFGTQINLLTIKNELLSSYCEIDEVCLDVQDNILIALIKPKNSEKFSASEYQNKMELNKILKKPPLGGYNYHRPAFSFLCSNPLRPEPLYIHITTHQQIELTDLISYYVKPIEQIWKNILLGGIEQAMIESIKIDWNLSFAELGGSSLTLGQMAIEVWQKFNRVVDYASDWQDYFHFVTSGCCSILELAKHLMIIDNITADVLLKTKNEEIFPDNPIFIISDQIKINKELKKSFANYTLINICPSTNLLKEIETHSQHQYLTQLSAKIVTFIKQHQSSGTVTALIDAESNYAKLLQKSYAGELVEIKKDIRRIQKIVDQNRTTSLKRKIALWHNTFIASHSVSNRAAYLSEFKKFTQVVDAAGSGKSTQICAMLSEYRDLDRFNIVALDMSNCWSIDQSLEKLKLTTNEVRELKCRKNIFLLDNIDQIKIPNHFTFLSLNKGWEKSKFVLYTRIPLAILSMIHQVQIRDDGVHNGIRVLSNNTQRRFGFYDNPLFQKWFSTYNQSIKEFLHILANWFNYDYHRKHQHLPSNNNFSQFLYTINYLYEKYATCGNTFCINATLSKWHNESHHEDAVLALPFFEHLLPLLELVDPNQYIYMLPTDWNEVLLETSLGLLLELGRLANSSYSQEMLALPRSTHNFGNQLANIPTELTKNLPLNYFVSVQPLTYSPNAPTIFFIYPLTGDVPREYYEMSKTLQNYTCIALKMADSSFYSVCDTRSNDLTQRAKYLATVIQSIQPMGPYSLVGWSFGSLLSYLIAQNLEANNETVNCIINIDGEPPNSSPGSNPLETVKNLLLNLAKRYQIKCYDTLNDRLQRKKYDSIQELIGEAISLLQKHFYDAEIQLFSSHLENIRDNLLAYYHYQSSEQKNINKITKLRTKMYLMIAQKKLPYLNENSQMADWIHFVSEVNDYTFNGLDHFSIFTGEVFDYIHRLIQRSNPITLFSAIHYRPIYEYVKSRTQDIQNEAARRFYSLLSLETSPTVVGEVDSNPLKINEESTRTEQLNAYSNMYLDQLDCKVGKEHGNNLTQQENVFQKIVSLFIDYQVIFCKGVPGSGKTMLCGQLESKLLEKFSDELPCIIPIMLPRSTKQTLSLESLSLHYQIDLKKILLGNQYSLLFIADEYSAQIISFINEIYNPFTASKIRFLLTGTGFANDQMLKDGITHQFLTLCSPSMNAIIDFCKRYDQCISNKINIYSLLEKLISQEPRITRLLNTPRNLQILLPKLVKYVQEGLHGTQNLYKISMQLFQSNITIQRSVTELNIRPGLNVQEASYNYAKSIAFELSSNGDNLELFDHNDADTQVLKKLCRVSKSSRGWHFEDPLYHHLLLASYLIDSLARFNPDNNIDKLVHTFAKVVLSKHTETIDYICDYIHGSAHSLINLINNLVYLLYLKNTKRYEPEISRIASSNALSILARCFHNLGDLMLNNLDFDEPTIDGSILDGANLQHTTINADFSRVSIGQAILHQTQFRKSTITLGKLTLPTSPNRILLSNCGTYLLYVIVQVGQSTIGVWDIKEDRAIVNDIINEKSLVQFVSCAFTSDDSVFYVALDEKIYFYEKNEATYVGQLLPIDHSQIPEIEPTDSDFSKPKLTDQQIERTVILIPDQSQLLLLNLYEDKLMSLDQYQYQIEKKQFIHFYQTQFINSDYANILESDLHDELEVQELHHGNSSLWSLYSNQSTCTLLFYQGPVCQNKDQWHNEKADILFKNLTMPTQDVFDERIAPPKITLDLRQLSVDSNIFTIGIVGQTFVIAMVKNVNETKQYIIINTLDSSNSNRHNEMILSQFVDKDLGIWSLKFNSSCTNLIGATHKSLVIWDVNTGRLLHELPLFDNQVPNFTLSKINSIVAYTVNQCVSDIFIIKIPERTQIAKNSYFHSVGVNGLCSLWQLSDQRYELRINGSFQNIPVHLALLSSPILHKSEPLLAYHHKKKVIVTRFRILEGADTQKSSPELTQEFDYNFDPICFLEDSYIALGEANKQHSYATIKALLNYQTQEIVKIPEQYQQQIFLNGRKPHIMIRHDNLAKWLIHYESYYKDNLTKIVFIPLTNTNQQQSTIFNLTGSGDIEFSVDTTTLLFTYHYNQLKIYQKNSSAEYANTICATLLKGTNNFLAVDNDNKLGLYRIDNAIIPIWQVRKNTLSNAYYIYANQDIVTVALKNGSILIFSASDGQFLDQIIQTYFGIEHCEFTLELLSNNDLIVTDTDHHEWYWRAHQDTTRKYWRLFWSATSADSCSATESLITQDSKLSPTLRRRLGFFGASEQSSKVTFIRTYQQQLLILLQRFYGIGINGSILSINWGKNPNHLAIKVNNIHREMILHLPLYVIKAAMPDCEVNMLVKTNTLELIRK